MGALFTPATVQVDLGGHTALVTGAASGIGLACAERLRAAGADVVMLDRDRARLEQQAAGLGGEAVFVDLADPAAVAALEVTADIIINCAGLRRCRPARISPLRRSRASSMSWRSRHLA